MKKRCDHGHAKKHCPICAEIKYFRRLAKAKKKSRQVKQ